jgi:hypothetical protein
MNNSNSSIYQLREAVDTLNNELDTDNIDQSIDLIWFDSEQGDLIPLLIIIDGDEFKPVFSDGFGPGDFEDAVDAVNYLLAQYPLRQSIDIHDSELKGLHLSSTLFSEEYEDQAIATLSREDKTFTLVVGLVLLLGLSCLGGLFLVDTYCSNIATGILT